MCLYFCAVTEEGSWRDRLKGSREARDVVRLVAWMNQSPGQGGSRPLQALGADNNLYWVKLTTNRQGPIVLVNEQIVGRCGALIGAPTCRVETVEIPESLAGEVSGIEVHPGLAHGSLEVPQTVNQRSLEHRAEDDNRRRHGGVYALHDWCWGQDSQWLFALSDENKTYSHDHGHFFPGGPTWQENPDLVRSRVDEPHELQQRLGTTGLDPDSVRELAEALMAVTGSDIAEILSAIPQEWPVEDTDLELLGFFLERRAPQVAARMLCLVPTEESS